MRRKGWIVVVLASLLMATGLWAEGSWLANFELLLKAKMAHDWLSCDLCLYNNVDFRYRDFSFPGRVTLMVRRMGEDSFSRATPPFVYKRDVSRDSFKVVTDWGPTVRGIHLEVPVEEIFKATQFNLTEGSFVYRASFLVFGRLAGDSLVSNEDSIQLVSTARRKAEAERDASLQEALRKEEEVKDEIKQRLLEKGWPARLEMGAYQEGYDLVVWFRPFNKDDRPVVCPGDVEVSLSHKFYGLGGGYAYPVSDGTILRKYVEKKDFKLWRSKWIGVPKRLCVLRIDLRDTPVCNGVSSIMRQTHDIGNTYRVKTVFTPFPGVATSIPGGYSVDQEDEVWLSVD